VSFKNTLASNNNTGIANKQIFLTLMKEHLLSHF